MSSFDLDKSDGTTPMEAEGVFRDGLQVASELERLKALGNELVKRSEWSAALGEYAKVLELFESESEALMSDFEAERRAERCALAAVSNMALCSLKVGDFAQAKLHCGSGLERQQKSRVPDPGARAKLLFRRGQAFLGLREPRMGVDSIAEAIDLEEQLLGATNKDASLKSDDVSKKQRVATIASMKRELAKARRAATMADKASVSKGHKGFLNVKSNRISDPKADRKAAIDRDLDRVLEALWGSKEGAGVPDSVVGGVADRAKALYEEAARDDDGGDSVNQARAAFCEGFACFIGGEVGDSSTREGCYRRAAEALSRYWNIRAEHPADADLAPPLNLGDVVAHEATGHTLIRVGYLEPAQTHLLSYVDKRDAAGGEIAAYHNLPDSFLLQRGLTKMDDAARRAYRWKHRSHAHRAVFDARTALVAIAKELGNKDEAISRARKCLELATDDQEKQSAHSNLAVVLSASWKDSSLPSSEAELSEAREHRDRAADLERAIKDKAQAQEQDNSKNAKGEKQEDRNEEEAPETPPSDDDDDGDPKAADATTVQQDDDDA